jgi:hypothetical protein
MDAAGIISRSLREAQTPRQKIAMEGDFLPRKG